MKKVLIPVIGSLVESVSGGDSGKTYIVIGFESNGYLLLCDGARHKLCSPKRKNAAHVKVTGAKVEELPKTDASVATTIRRNTKI